MMVSTASIWQKNGRRASSGGFRQYSFPIQCAEATLAPYRQIARHTSLPKTGRSVAPSDERARARQNDPKFGELTGLRIDLNRPAMELANAGNGIACEMGNKINS
jgi:hypothetical protein